jgi:hypothetical protein
MDPHNRLCYLFFSGNSNLSLGKTLPSFVTSTLYWEDYDEYFPAEKFPLGIFNIDTHLNDDFIQLRQNKGLGLFYLDYHPCEYFVEQNYNTSNDEYATIFKKNRALLTLHSKHSFDYNAVVWVTNHYKRGCEQHGHSFLEHLRCIFLIGNFEKNMWGIIRYHYISYLRRLEAL